MRAPSSFSLMGGAFFHPLAQAMAKRDPLVEHKTFAAPSALGFRYLFEISEDAALEMIDFGEALREQERARFLAADAAGAEHRDLPVLCAIKRLRGERLEL